jgi:hypothetical protein
MLRSKVVFVSSSQSSDTKYRQGRDLEQRTSASPQVFFSLNPSAALPGAMVEHQYPVYLQFFTQGSIPPVFCLILHDGLMVSPSGSETHTRPPTLLRVAVAVAACCALYLRVFGRRVRSSPLHSNCSLDGVWFSFPVSCATHSRSAMVSVPLLIRSLSSVVFCFLDMCYVYSFYQIAALLQQVAYLNNRIDASNVHEPL